MNKIIDLSHEINNNTLVFKGDKLPEIITNSDELFVNSDFYGSLHTATHIDTAYHTKSNKKTIAKYNLSNFIGIAVLIDVSGQNFIKLDLEWANIIKNHNIVIFRTLHSNKWQTDEYFSNYPEFDKEIADFLIKHKVKIFGIDSPSADYEPYPFHKKFLKSSRMMIENLTNLDKIPANKDFKLYSIPLKIEAEASLIRAFAEI